MTTRQLCDQIPIHRCISQRGIEYCYGAVPGLVVGDVAASVLALAGCSSVLLLAWDSTPFGSPSQTAGTAHEQTRTGDGWEAGDGWRLLWGHYLQEYVGSANAFVPTCSLYLFRKRSEVVVPPAGESALWCDCWFVEPSAAIGYIETGGAVGYMADILTGQYDGVNFVFRQDAVQADPLRVLLTEKFFTNGDHDGEWVPDVRTGRSIRWWRGIRFPVLCLSRTGLVGACVTPDELTTCPMALFRSGYYNGLRIVSTEGKMYVVEQAKRSFGLRSLLKAALVGKTEVNILSLSGPQSISLADVKREVCHSIDAHWVKIAGCLYPDGGFPVGPPAAEILSGAECVGDIIRELCV